MPFTIRLTSCNSAPTAGTPFDPIADWERPRFAPAGLSTIERGAMKALLARKGGRRPGIDDRVHLSLHDGSIAEVHLVGLYTGSACIEGIATVETISLPFLQLAVELATEGRLILHPQGFPRPLVVSEQLRHELHVRFPQVQSVFSAAMLWNLLVPRPVEPAE